MMHFDRISLGREAKELGFVRDSFEKVQRLVDVLAFMEEDSVLRDSLALKGGTAINLTIFDLPRLSVDIDLDYTKNLSRDEMLDQREVVSSRIENYMVQNGYHATNRSKQYHALDSFVFSYQNSGNMMDNLKVEINYVLRCHVLELNRCSICGTMLGRDCSVLRLDPTEIFASKIVALLNRSKPRDLYDLSNFLQSNLVQSVDLSLLRKCVVFYTAIGSDTMLTEYSFQRLRNISQNRIKTDLVPVIKSGEFFDARKAVDNCIPFLQELLTISEEERQFLKLFHEKIYLPELLFNDEAILSRITNHPMAIWKCSEPSLDSPDLHSERRNDLQR